MELPIWKLCRYHLLLLTFIGNMLAYMVRFSFNVTVLDMTNPANDNHVNWVGIDGLKTQFSNTILYVKSKIILNIDNTRYCPDTSSFLLWILL